MALLDPSDVTAFLDDHPDWQHADDTLTRTFEFEDFVEAMGFVVSVGLKAERANHHPDIDIRWNRVTLQLSTHSEGGLTAKDTDLASSIDALAAA